MEITSRFIDCTCTTMIMMSGVYFNEWMKEVNDYKDNKCLLSGSLSWIYINGVFYLESINVFRLLTTDMFAIPSLCKCNGFMTFSLLKRTWLIGWALKGIRYMFNSTFICHWRYLSWQKKIRAFFTYNPKWCSYIESNLRLFRYKLIAINMVLHH